MTEVDGDDVRVVTSVTVGDFVEEPYVVCVDFERGW